MNTHDLKEALLNATTDNDRNKLALDVLDHNVTECIPTLVAMLDGNTVPMNERGTLVYVLTEMRYEIPFVTLIKNMVYGSYEAAQESLINFSLSDDSASHAMVLDAIKCLQSEDQTDRTTKVITYLTENLNDADEPMIVLSDLADCINTDT